MNKDSLVFLKHIKDNIDIIEQFSSGLTKEGLLKDILKQYAVIRAIEIIGEAAKNIPSNFKSNHKEIDWKEIIGTRDKIIHHYFGVNLDIIWNIIRKDLPKLKEQIKVILEKDK